MWLLFVLLLLFVAAAATTNGTIESLQKNLATTQGYLLNTEIYLDYLICAKYRHRDGYFEYEKCNRYPETGLFPFCVYMIVPSNETHRGYDKYGCVYAHHLPQECINNKKRYFEHVTVPFRGINHSGSAMCCMDNFCNESEDPMFTSIRIKKKLAFASEDAVPIILAVIIIVVTVIPWLDGEAEEYHGKQVRDLDAPILIEERFASSTFPRIQEVMDVHRQPMTFDSLKKMQKVANEVLKVLKQRISASQTRTSGSESGNTSDESLSPIDSHGQLVEETHYNTPVELIIYPICYVFERDKDAPYKVLRSIPTKYDHLAQKMIEHGPYAFDFDVVELGEMFDSVVPILAAETSLLDLPEDTYVYGNLDGSYGDLFRWFHKNGWPPKIRVLFLGGLTHDRSEFSLETIALIFAMKKLMPQHVYILRGVAEVFPLRIGTRFTRRIARALQNVVLRACGYLPLAATIGSVFLSHGGCPQSTEEVKQIQQLRRPMFTIPEGSIANKLIFSQAGPNEIAPPSSRGTLICGETMLDVLVPETGQTFSLFIRSRNPCPHGYMFIGEQILSIWSAVGVPEGNKAGASVYIDRNMNVHLSKMTDGLFEKQELARRQEQLREMAKEKKRKRLEARKKKEDERRKAKDVAKRDQAEKKKAKKSNMLPPVQAVGPKPEGRTGTKVKSVAIFPAK